MEDIQKNKRELLGLIVSNKMDKLINQNFPFSQMLFEPSAS